MPAARRSFASSTPALTWVQLAGDEDIELARSLGVPW